VHVQRLQQAQVDLRVCESSACAAQRLRGESYPSNVMLLQLALKLAWGGKGARAASVCQLRVAAAAAMAHI